MINMTFDDYPESESKNLGFWNEEADKGGIIVHDHSGGSRIFQRGCANSQIEIILQFFAKNCMKMKEFGPRGGAYATFYCVPYKFCQKAFFV